MLTAGAVLEFVDKELEGCTVGDVLADPKRFDRRVLADPIEGVAYGRTTAIVMLRRSDRSSMDQVIRPWRDVLHAGARRRRRGEAQGFLRLHADAQLHLCAIARAVARQPASMPVSRRS